MWVLQHKTMPDCMAWVVVVVVEVSYNWYQCYCLLWSLYNTSSEAQNYAHFWCFGCGSSSRNISRWYQCHCLMWNLCNMSSEAQNYAYVFGFGCGGGSRNISRWYQCHCLMWNLCNMSSEAQNYAHFCFGFGCSGGNRNISRWYQCHCMMWNIYHASSEAQNYAQCYGLSCGCGSRGILQLVLVLLLDVKHLQCVFWSTKLCPVLWLGLWLW